MTTCETCGLVTDALVLRCPRCGSALALGCAGSCRSCGKHRLAGESPDRDYDQRGQHSQPMNPATAAGAVAGADR